MAKRTANKKKSTRKKMTTETTRTKKPTSKRKPKRTKPPNGNGANLGFEATLWAAADKLRGHMDAAVYKHVVLGLIFLKYISDAFQERYDDLAARQEKDYTDPEDRDEYEASNTFWVPPDARWPYLLKNAEQTTIGKIIDAAMTAIERDIPGFCKSATTDEIATHGHVLTPGRYVGAEAIEDDGEPFEEKMQRLTTTLGEQFAESKKLEKQIWANLESLGCVK